MWAGGGYKPKQDKSITRDEKTREDKRSLPQDKYNFRVLYCCLVLLGLFIHFAPIYMSLPHYLMTLPTNENDLAKKYVARSYICVVRSLRSVASTLFFMGEKMT